MNPLFSNRSLRSVGGKRTAGRDGTPPQLPGNFPRFYFWWLLALITMPAYALDPAEKPRDYILTRWDAEDGLPQSLVRQILQTKDGYLWLGTPQGLSRFDGLRFTNFKAADTPGFPGNLITSLAETSDGSVWIGTPAGLGQYHEGRFTTYTQKDGLKADLVNALCVAPDGSLWIGGAFGIIRWVDGKFLQDIDTSAHNLLGIVSITVDRRKAVWLAIGTAALRYEDGQFTRFGPEQGLPSNGIQSIREDADGRTLAVTQSGLFQLEEQRFAPFESRLVSPRLNTVLVDRDRNLWIGSAAGLERYSNGKIELYVNPTGENSDGIETIFEDREGCLWLGGSTGLARLVNRRARTLSVEEGVLGTTALAILQSRDASVWVSSWTGGVARFQNGTVRQYRARAPLSHESVTCIYEAPDGTMWFGNRGSSLDHLEGDKVTTFVYPPGIPTSRFVSAMYAEAEGDFLIGIASRGLFTLQNEQFVPVPEAALLSSATIWKIHRTQDGRLLFATTVGLCERASDGSFHRVLLSGIPGVGPPVRGLLEDHDGGIWLATEGQGLIYWKDGTARGYSIREGMIDDHISSVLDDGAGFIWVTSARGLARIPRTEFADLDKGNIARLNIMTFGRVDGLLNASASTGGAPVSAHLADGSLMFATGKGVALIDPRSLQVNNRPPKLMIEGVSADDKPLVAEPGRRMLVPAGTYRLEIRFTALSLIAPHRLRFRYQLKGSDPDWIEAGHERSARYTHLAPGNYTFQVLACNSDGVWNKTGATLAFTVRPFFYQTGWFAGLTALAGSLVIFGAYRTRVRVERHRLAALEALVGKRTHELRHAKEAAEDAREEIVREQARFKFIFEALPVGVAWMVRGKLESRIVNPAHAQMSSVSIADRQQLKLYREATHPDDRMIQDELHRRLVAGEIDHYEMEKRYVHPDGRICWVAQSVRFFVDPASGETQEVNTLVDITEHKRAGVERENLHQQLLDVSRNAGMAEVATSVLHNVGNVLNSVNVSATLVTDHVRHSKAANVAKLAAMFDEHKTDLASFLTRDPRGQLVPAYLGTLTESLAQEQKIVTTELDHLQKNIEHIKHIVAMQQSLAKNSGVIASVDLADLVDDAVRIDADALVRHQIKLVRDFQARPTISTDKHKIAQILINLLRNAKYACDDAGRTDKQITLRITADSGHVAIAVSDNGVGIPAENLTRIFNHGFTTRAHGHGFGLHSGALAAKELGGSLTVLSAGPGTGATFILQLPGKPASTAASP